MDYNTYIESEASTDLFSIRQVPSLPIFQVHLQRNEWDSILVYTMLQLHELPSGTLYVIGIRPST